MDYVDNKDYNLIMKILFFALMFRNNERVNPIKMRRKGATMRTDDGISIGVMTYK